MLKMLLLVSAISGISAPAVAQALPAGVSAAITAGTLGVGPELAFRGDRIGIRGNATFLSVSPSFNSGDIDYDGHAKLRSAGVMVDYFPTGGGFRLSAGGRINGNRARAVATPTTNTSVGGVTYTPAQIGTLSSRADVKNLAPALTLGYAGKRARGFVFGIEAGALFQGRVRIDRIASTSTFASNAAFQASLEQERRDLQDDIDKYKVYPILQLSAGWRF